MGEVVVARRGSPWVGWPWLTMGSLACCGSFGFDGLAGLDSMVARLASMVVGLV